MPIIKTARLSNDVYALDLKQCKTAGSTLKLEYVTADPFPHIVIDDFIDSELLRALVAEWPSTTDKSYFDRQQERFKYQWQPHELTTPALRSFLAEMNSEPMIRFVESLTGIENLISDPYYSGAGLHETFRGGHLGIHADFNVHNEMKVLRRVNLLIYLNDNWRPEYGGALELWSKDMSTLRRKIDPVMGRAVIFNTALDSFHGHPDRLNCPSNRSRRSIALYYYTALDDASCNLSVRTTQFRKRPRSADAVDVAVALRHTVRDWVPPALLRAFSRKRKLPVN